MEKEKKELTEMMEKMKLELENKRLKDELEKERREKEQLKLNEQRYRCCFVVWFIIVVHSLVGLSFGIIKIG